MISRSILLGALAFVLGANLSNPAAAAILVLGINGQPGATQAQAVVTHLNNTPGYSATYATALPGDLSGIDQIWDFRISGAAGALTANSGALISYLNDGGRLFIAGERSTGYNPRNTEVLGFLASAGAGTMTLTSPFAGGTFSNQAVITGTPFETDPDQTLSQIRLNGGNRVVASSITNGFMMTNDLVLPGQGTFVGYDFGDIAGSPNARMIVGFDVDFGLTYSTWTAANARQLTSEFADYLAAPTPEPASLAIWGLGSLACIAVARRKRRAAASN